MKLIFEYFDNSDYHYMTYPAEYESKEKFIDDLKNAYSNALANKSVKFNFLNTSFCTNSFDIESISAIELDEWFEANKL